MRSTVYTATHSLHRSFFRPHSEIQVEDGGDLGSKFLWVDEMDSKWCDGEPVR